MPTMSGYSSRFLCPKSRVLICNMRHEKSRPTWTDLAYPKAGICIRTCKAALKPNVSQQVFFHDTYLSCRAVPGDDQSGSWRGCITQVVSLLFHSGHPGMFSSGWEYHCPFLRSLRSAQGPPLALTNTHLTAHLLRVIAQASLALADRKKVLDHGLIWNCVCAV